MENLFRSGGDMLCALFLVCNYKKQNGRTKTENSILVLPLLDKTFKRQTDVFISYQQVVDQHVLELP